MTRTGLGIALILGLLAYGCGRSNYELVDSTTTSTPVPQAGTGPSYSLRLLGVDLGDFVAANMRIRAVQVTGGGALLANTVKNPEVDLARQDNAYLLATFQVPDGVEDVDFLVSFESGALATAKDKFDVDTRCQTLRMAGKVSRIAERKHAVIHLDVARSFVPSTVGLMLVPHFQLVY
jgi:hypothetical protein